MSVGLLLLRAYAVTDHRRLVLAVLCLLGVYTIVPDVVCTHIHFCDKHVRQTPTQAATVMNNCALTSAQIHAVIM